MSCGYAGFTRAIDGSVWSVDQSRIAADPLIEFAGDGCSSPWRKYFVILFRISAFEQNITRHLFKQQRLILTAPPAGEKILVVVTDDDQIHLKIIRQARDFIGRVSRHKMLGRSNVPFPKSIDSFLKNGARRLFVDVETDRRQDVESPCPTRAIDDRDQVSVGSELFRERRAAPQGGLSLRCSVIAKQDPLK
jgi:hypothetical protein